MLKINKTVLSITLILVFLSCSKRERLNPLDLENPNTAGKPTGLTLLPIRDTVKISWEEIEVNNLSTYVLYKGIAYSGLTQVATISSDSTEYTDTDVNFYETYSYAVQGVTDFMESPLSEAASITVGPYSIYVADFFDNSVRILSWDGSVLVKRRSVSSPRVIQYRESDRRFLLANYYDRMVVLLSTDLNDADYIEIGDYLLDLAVNQSNHHLYVLTRSGTILEFDESNQMVDSRSLGLQPGWDAQMELDPIDFGLWTSIPDSGMVHYVSKANDGENNQFFKELDYPSALSSYNGCWVATRSGIANLSTNGDSEIFEKNVWVTDVEIDTVAKECFYIGKNLEQNKWVAGKINLEAKSKTILLDGDYRYLNQIFPFTTDNGTEFLVQEAVTWTLIRFNENGEKIGEIGDFNSRLDFQIY